MKPHEAEKFSQQPLAIFLDLIDWESNVAEI
jgi:hypothetical protein